MTSSVPDESVSKPAPIDASHMVQVVNYEEHFNDELGAFLQAVKIASLGFDYNVTAIMGPQSSGKSTLMNMLFGTRFPTMDSGGGRYQVTQGVWLGRDSDAAILVLDLEGTDSRERGDDAATYERKSALFALALAEVLVVNVWIHDVGRNNASNMPLLRTIMELDLQLFFGASGSDHNAKRMPKTKLLFVIRDYDATPMDKLCASLREDLDNIWNTINKPPAAEGTPITDYFDLAFEALPHKIYCPKEFEQKVAELKVRFHEDGIFKDEYSRGVAADGFSEYARSVWETIRANKELDIPSQKEMLAHVRCEQIAKEVFNHFGTAIAPLQEQLLPPDRSAPVIVASLFDSLLQNCNAAMDRYGEGASRYSKTVADMKAEDVRAHLTAESKMLLDAQITAASDAAVKEFQESVNGGKDKKHKSQPWLNWNEQSQDALQRAMDIFDDACTALSLSESISDESALQSHPLYFAIGSTASSRRRLEKTLGTELQRATERVLSETRMYCLQTFQSAFKAPMTSVLESVPDDLWSRASEVADASWDATAKEARWVYGAHGLALAEAEMERVVEEDLKNECHDAAMNDIKAAIGTPSNLLLRMMKRFEDTFRFDERGVPRVFGPTEDIEALFVVAREKGEQLAEVLAEIKLSGTLATRTRASRDLTSTRADEGIVIDSILQADLKDKLKRQSGAIFMEAKRAQEAARITTKIPIWLLGVVLILGWNELMAVLRSPLLLMLTLVVVPIVYVGFTMDAPTYLMPAVVATLKPMLEQAKDALDQATRAPVGASGDAGVAVAHGALSDSTAVSTSGARTDETENAGGEKES
ncbi:Protein SEY1 [Gracilariopsis chorda]|uniref:Protein SEY1 homolog n=1 Tax=Gracilariopsis chorda TaxID=448386 RepID=A0A2V3IWI8_9FLOR|nr:Protein SEY1 [Gracilariopsis chorda]|eukprot:PXF46443.1 Protein SEY1 [Gracilariopsis chorda]